MTQPTPWDVHGTPSWEALCRELAAAPFCRVPVRQAECLRWPAFPSVYGLEEDPDLHVKDETALGVEEHDAMLGCRWDRSAFVTCQRVDDGIMPASLVVVEFPAPHFTLVGRAGRLVDAEDTPPQVLALIDAVGVGPWDHVEVTGGPQGIFVNRGTTLGSDPDEPVKPGWPYDLWLAEHIAAALTTQP